MSTARPKVLVVDDEAAMREVLEMRLQPWGFDVFLAEDGEQARRMVARHDPAVVITDVSLPDFSGLELLRWLRETNSQREVILITAYGSIDAAVRAMKFGARDFLTKPLDYHKLEALLAEALSDNERGSARQTLERRLEQRSGLGPIVGTSRPMRKLYKTIRLLAQNEASAIITGESGTGKELVGRTIHELSGRRDKPYLAVNTAAIAEGLVESELFGHEKGAFTGAVATKAGWFELADQGTLFLDEFAEMPTPLQPKFLRVLEDSRVRRLGGAREMEFDVRLLAATNRHPARAVEEGVLREDLYYRLNVFTVDLPPLRQRQEDIPLLAQHFVGAFNRKHGVEVEGLESEALERLQAYPWPGNVREMRNVMERAVILAREGWIGRQQLPPYVWSRSGELQSRLTLPAKVTLAEAERLLIEETLRQVANNKAKAARQLGLDVKTIRNKLKTYGDVANGAG